MDRLHPGAKWQFRMGGYLLSGFLGIFLAVWIIAPLAGLLLKLGGISGGSVVTIVLLSILGYLLFVIVFSEIYAQMSYNRWFYEFTEEGLRLERGIIWKRYSNVPYERIQNVDLAFQAS